MNSYIFHLHINSFGHGKSESYSNWILSNNNITGIITIPSHEVTRLPMINERTSSLSSSFLKHAEENIFVYSQETSCLLGSSYILRSSDGFIRVELQYNCPQTLPTRINYRAIFELSPSHSHYAKIYHQGQLISERLISNASPPWEIDTSNTVKRNQSFISFFVLGMEHILSGYDHLAFLFGILYQGGAELDFELQNVSRDIVVVMQGLVILFCGGLEYLYRPVLIRYLAPVEASE